MVDSLWNLSLLVEKMYEKQIDTCSNCLLITSSLLLLVVITGKSIFLN